MEKVWALNTNQPSCLNFPSLDAVIVMCSEVRIKLFYTLKHTFKIGAPETKFTSVNILVHSQWKNQGRKPPITPLLSLGWSTEEPLQPSA